MREPFGGALNACRRCLFYLIFNIYLNIVCVLVGFLEANIESFRPVIVSLLFLIINTTMGSLNINICLCI